MENIHRSDLLGRQWVCECGLKHSVPTRVAIIESGALTKVPSVLECLHLKGPVLLLADTTTFRIAGESLQKILTTAGFKVHLLCLPDHPHADDVTADEVVKKISLQEGVLISCGSGVITDLGKYAAHQKGFPFLAVATAPSMNGYASGIVALTKGGLKTTGAVTPALGIIADIDILARAPLEMIQAGLGDLLSKPVCNADWKLSSLVTGEHFCSKPFELIRDLEKMYAEHSELLLRRDPKTIKALTEAIVYSGVSMVMAGSSSPASGGEHLISHFLDMRAPFEKRTPDFHGAQVGVATIATAQLYERLISKSLSDFSKAKIDSAYDRAQEALLRCRDIFGDIFPSIEKEFQKKWGDRKEVSARTEKLFSQWKTIQRDVSTYLLPSAHLAKILSNAGAKTHFSQLGVSPPLFHEALELAFSIRSRYTVLDVAHTFGELLPWAKDVCR